MCFYQIDWYRNITNMSQDIQDVPESQDQDDVNEEDVFSILVATDIHLGYAEKDPIRSKDTIETFEEILKIAQQQSVDFILLGGDLFHDTRPSTYCLYKCIELLKRYCLGDRPVQIEYLSDASLDFSYASSDTVNYEDPNLNVAIPVFSIHGNHDDPTGEEQVSALNLLASTGLVNYFGRQSHFQSIELNPILLKKGESQLAIYGLSHVKDEKLSRLFLEKKVSLKRPDGDNWFHLCVLHQNRANRGVKTFIPDDSLPELLDLAIWGHEHDCRITEEQASNGVYISQPGSTVATSLCAGEAMQKHVALLKINKDRFFLEPIPLKTIRPFIFREFLLKSPEELRKEDGEYRLEDGDSDEVVASKVVDAEIQKMIKDAKELDLVGNKMPLIRLIVIYSSESQWFNVIRFGQRYVGQVANAADMIKLKLGLSKPRSKPGENCDDLLKAQIVLPNRVEDLVTEYFESSDKKLGCLPLRALNESVIRFVETKEEDAPTDVIEFITKERRNKMKEVNVEIEEVHNFLLAEKDHDDDAAIVEKVLNDPSRKKQTNEVQIDSASDDDDVSPVRTSFGNTTVARGSPSNRPLRGPGSRGGRGSRGRRRTGGRTMAN